MSGYVFLTISIISLISYSICSASSTSFKRLAIVLGSGVFKANKFNLDLSGSIIRSTKLQVNINLVVKLNDSITFLSAA